MRRAGLSASVELLIWDEGPNEHEILRKLWRKLWIRLCSTWNHGLKPSSAPGCSKYKAAKIKVYW